ncbi:MAG: peptidoglycan recognition family protein [Gordonia sp. (in: high G+C Gram-positive bacteria)]|uniref:peptidoglycan recognition protein family protein n=1 Tax=Gordonia sp. (in: high G+C Gram-positive bacteria) TaxID=84139 RepID=UPI003C7698D6
MADQFRADRDMLSPNDDGVRYGRPSLVIAHTNEGDANGRADDLGAWLQKPESEASYTMIVDRAGRTVRSNDDNYVPWAAGSPANERGLHLCFIGRASQSRKDWLNQDKQLRAGARVAADWCRRYNIPAGWLSGDQMRSGLSGIGGHDTTVQAWHATDHTDPGTGFPRDRFIQLVNEYLTGATEQDDGMAFTDEDRRKLNYIYNQLRPWPQLGANAKGEPLTLVDAVASIKDEAA